MDVIFFYLLACLPFIIGGILWALDKKIVWQEWIGGSVLGFVVAGLFHWMAIAGATADVETWSGHIIKATHFPRWVEEYYVTHFTYDSKGNISGSYTTTEYTTHQEYWEAYSNISTSYGISLTLYSEMCQVFGNRVTETPSKSGFYSGDKNVYPTYNHNKGEHYPITSMRSWSNKVRATPSTFSFPQVPKGTKVFPYPPNKDPFSSDRLIGSATLVNLLEFDRMNARLGPSKKVNVILIGMGDRDSMAAQWQEAAYIGGKKNDVCLVWGGSNKKPTWVRAFGWTDSKTCLRTLESIVLEKGISDSTLPLIEREIRDNYKLKDFKKAFGHLSIPAPMWSVWTYLLVTIVGQTLFWFWAHNNDTNKGGYYSSRRFSYSYDRR